ncbi:hypothetical protein FTUN_0185 [Frigoriglobus tundricola]|uniref:Uncharacterized protein n=1 Tax=Frigoriglobus tundricola TaxID=2774151 RepID=A0A6M5YFD2_9BACT|nr:hypothetical protein FTUN_0185 [Frigoriglobus tundricola]
MRSARLPLATLLVLFAATLGALLAFAGIFWVMCLWLASLLPDFGSG